MKRAALTGLLAFTAACAPTPREAERAAANAAEAQAELAEELAGLTPGRPTACLDQPQRVQVNTKGYGDVIVFRVSDTVKYRNDTTGGCRNHARGDFLITGTPTGRLCRGDIMQTVDPASRFPTGSCSLGEFIPYRRP